jgi:LMBR1 domain-containing protein 1
VGELYHKAAEMDLQKWKREVLTKSQYGEPFLRFVLTTIISLGALLKIIYLSYGMAGLPMYLIKGTRSLEAENQEIYMSITQVRDKLRRIQEKYQQSNKQTISAKDKAQLKKLRREEKLLNSKHTEISNLQNQEGENWMVIHMALKFLTPFRVAIGVFCLCISLLLMYSLLVNNLERLFDSDCGAKCGFILTKSPTYFNPLDAILLRLSSHHEKWFDFHCSLDTTLFAILLIYVFICVIYGLVRIGIGFVSSSENRVRRRDSSP